METTRAYGERDASDEVAASDRRGDALKVADLAAGSATAAFATAVQDPSGRMRKKLADEPRQRSILRRIAGDGRFHPRRAQPRPTLKDVKDRCSIPSNVGGRWYMENRAGRLAHAQGVSAPWPNPD